MDSVSLEPVKNSTEVEVEVFFRNFDQKNLVAPLREVRAAQLRPTPSPKASEATRRAALELQEKWEHWLVQRELLRNDLRRGKEFLEHTQKELARLRGMLEEWPAYERVCGKNPLLDYMQSVAAHERIEQYLPTWLKRREKDLEALTRSLEDCARQNGLEHLL